MVDALIFEHDYFHRFRYCVVAMLSRRYLPYWVLEVWNYPFTVGIWYPEDELFSTDSLLTKLMIYIINTGSLTRYYSCFQVTLHLDSYFVQYVFNGSLHHSEVSIIVHYGSSLIISCSVQ